MLLLICCCFLAFLTHLTLLLSHPKEAASNFCQLTGAYAAELPLPELLRGSSFSGLIELRLE
jgi:hypothetical protein